jgi:hypothetical protein
MEPTNKKPPTYEQTLKDAEDSHERDSQTNAADPKTDADAVLDELDKPNKDEPDYDQL